MSLSLRCRRYLVMSYSVFLAICGIALIVIGSWMIYLYINHYGLGLQNKGWGPMGAFIGCGVACLPIGWLGWRAAEKRKIWIAALFVFLLSCLTIALIIICVMALVLRESVPDGSSTIKTSFSKSLEEEPQHFKYWEKVQNELQCCGVSGPADYFDRVGIPWTCCSTKGSAFQGVCQAVFQRGCSDVLIDDMKKLLAYAAVIAIGFAIVLSMGLFCSGHFTVKLIQCEKARKAALKTATSVTGSQAKSLLNGKTVPCSKV